jgi:hypothetical protein
MLVVDRRVDQSAYAPGANRADVQAQLEKFHLPHGQFESTAVPALVETELPVHNPESRGVPCVIETPGEQVLLNLLLERVWGVKVPHQ